MVVDRGGLRYTIEVADKFSSATQSFRAEIDASREAWSRFRTEVRDFAADSKGIAAGLKALAKQAQQNADQTERGARASKKAADASDLRSKAEKKLAADLERSQVAIKARAIADERNVPIYKKLSREATIRQQAEARLQKTLDKRAVDELSRQLAAERGIALDQKKRVTLTALERAEQRLSRIVAKRKEDEILRQIAEERGIQLSQKKTKVFDAEAEALKRIARAEQQRSVAQALQGKGFDAKGNKLTEPPGVQEVAQQRVAANIRRLQEDLAFKEAAKGSEELQRLRKELGLTDNVANRVSFTFRRLFGILAAFTLVRQLIAGFRDLVVSSVAFNSKIEQTRLGIASLFTAVGDVRDATGQTVDSARALVLAQSEARRQTELLRLDALRTVATFDTLAETFQVALAPGLAAGLDVDRIRRFAVQISQAAAAIGLQQNQLAEEVRSILQGTIQARTTRIAVALGITNEDIRRAKELGVLGDFLEDRFKAFNEAGKESLKTFEGLASNVKDSFLLVLSSAGLGFFTELKGLLSDILDSITDIGSEQITVNPAVVAVVQGIYDGLQAAVAEARRLGQVLSFGDLVGAGRAVGVAFEIVAKLLGGAIEGFVNGLRDAQSIGAEIAQIFSDVFALAGFVLPVGDLQSVVALAAELLTLLGAVKLVAVGVGGAVSLLGGAFKAITFAASGLLTTFKSIVPAVRGIALGLSLALSPAGLIAAAIAIVLKVVLDIVEELFGVEISFRTIVQLVRVTLVAAIKFAAATLKVAFLTAFNAVKIAVRSIVAGFREAILGVLDAATFVAEKLGLEVDAFAKKIQALQDKSRDSFLAETKKDADAIADAAKEALESYKASGEQFVAGVKDAFDPSKDTGEGILGTLAEQGKAFLGDIFGGSLDLGIGDDVAQAEKLSKVIDALPGLIARSRREFTDSSEVVKNLTDDVKAAQDALNAGLAARGLSSGVQRQVQLVFEAQAKSREELILLNAQLADAERRRDAQRQAELETRRSIARLSEQEVADVEAVVKASTVRLNLQRGIAGLKSEEAVLESAIEKARRDGDAKRLKTLEAERDNVSANIGEFTNMLELQAEFTDNLLAGLDPARAAEVQRLALDVVRSAGEQRTTSEEINALLEDRGRIEGLIQQAVEKRIRLISAEESLAIRDSTIELRAQVEAARELARVRESPFSGVSQVDRDTAQANAALLIEQAKLQLIDEENERNAEALRLTIAATKSADLRLALEEQLAATLEEGSLKYQEQAAKVDEINAKLADLNFIANEPITAGVFAALNEFTIDNGNTFQNTLDAMKAALERFADFTSSAIIDALDPTKDETALQRFAKFMKQVSDIIIQELTKVAIAELLLQLGFGAAGGAKGGSGAKASGGAHGGKVVSGTPSAAHFGPRARGRAHGGVERPKGLDPRDRIPVWARVDEWMIPPESAGLYGDGVMELLRRGEIDPVALRALAGARRSQRARTVGAHRGAADGGKAVGNNPAGFDSIHSVDRLLVTDERHARRVLKNGRQALRDAVGEDRAALVEQLRLSGDRTRGD